MAVNGKSSKRDLEALRRRYEREYGQCSLFLAGWDEVYHSFCWLDTLASLLEERARTLRERREALEEQLVLSAAGAGGKPLGSLAQLVRRGREGASGGAEVPVVPVGKARHGVVGACERKRADGVLKGWQGACQGDILFARGKDSIRAGAFGLLEEKYALASPEFFVLRPLPVVMPEWLLRCLDLPAVRRELCGYCTGTAMERLPQDTFLRLELPAPPQSLQRAVLELIREYDREPENGAAEQARRIRTLLREEQDQMMAPGFLQSGQVEKICGEISRQIREAGG